ncbi:cytochrome P450 [Xylariomycetidae sp. FL2044]|nr:cytochrome P450 [Xylariomycetidae sp. FL2044]
MLGIIVIAVSTVVASYLYSRLRYGRYTQYAHIPQLPNHLLWGHLKAFGEFTSRGIPDRHTDKILEEMWSSIGRPPVMLVDLRPTIPPLLVVSTHDMAEQISKPSQLFPSSITKSPTYGNLLPLIGQASILTKEDDIWKDLRKRYNPGFSPQYLSQLLPRILNKMGIFCALLDDYVSSSDEFSLEVLIRSLTFDVIGDVVMDVDLHAQGKDPAQKGDLIRLFGQLLKTYHDDKHNLPSWLAPRTALKRHRLAGQIDTSIRRTIQQKYYEVKEEAEGNRSRSILALSLRGTETLTPQLLSETADQVRTFLFAGHDTTTSMLEWAIYELSRTPRALKAVRDELDQLLGPQSDPREICTILGEKGEQLLPKLTYVNAVIRETLRLHPPAATARMAAPGRGFTLSTSTGEEYLVDGTILYPCLNIIQRDPIVYGDTADEWVPERWLGDEANKIPASAWRPFERGPRNCMGLELVYLESRIMIALVARKYDFSKVGLGESVLDEKGLPVLDVKGQFRVKSELYNTRRMTAQPADGTRMKVKLAA